MVKVFINCMGQTDLIDVHINNNNNNNSDEEEFNNSDSLLTQVLSYYSSVKKIDFGRKDDLKNMYLLSQGGFIISNSSSETHTTASSVHSPSLITTNEMGILLPVLLSSSSSSVNYLIQEFDTLSLQFQLCGGIDFQHREGSKIGSGGQSSEAQAAIERRERLRKLALETIDISKDPYIMKNHLGSFECKLCLTLHPNEGNYLAHTQGKRHQSNLGRRASMDAKNAAPKPMVSTTATAVSKKRVLKIGRPGYKVTKSRDVHTRQRSLTFEIDYPQIEEDIQPRHRFMSAYEQKVDTPADKNYQYLLFACEPYEIIGFKIPNQPIDKSEGRFFTNWDAKSHKFVLQLFFLEQPVASTGVAAVTAGVAVQQQQYAAVQ